MTAPYTFTWVPVAAATPTRTARATDCRGAATTSAPATVVLRVRAGDAAGNLSAWSQALMGVTLHPRATLRRFVGRIDLANGHAACAFASLTGLPSTCSSAVTARPTCSRAST